MFRLVSVDHLKMKIFQIKGEFLFFRNAHIFKCCNVHSDALATGLFNFHSCFLFCFFNHYQAQMLQGIHASQATFVSGCALFL